MRPSICFLLLAGLFLCLPQRVAARQSTHTVSIHVDPIALLDLNEATQTLSVPSGAAGAVEQAAAYAITTNLSGAVLTAALDVPLPEGVRLFVHCTSLLGRSLGPIELTGVQGAVTVVTGVRHGGEHARLTYRMETAPGVTLPLQSRRITLTLAAPGVSTQAVAGQDLLVAVGATTSQASGSRE